MGQRALLLAKARIILPSIGSVLALYTKQRIWEFLQKATKETKGGKR